MCPPHHLEALQEATGRHWDSTQKKRFLLVPASPSQSSLESSGLGRRCWAPVWLCSLSVLSSRHPCRWCLVSRAQWPSAGARLLWKSRRMWFSIACCTGPRDKGQGMGEETQRE